VAEANLAQNNITKSKQKKELKLPPTFNYINNLPSKSIQTVNSLNQLILIMPHPAQISTPAIIN
jgi:hypothetical protein